MRWGSLTPAAAASLFGGTPLPIPLPRPAGSGRAPQAGSAEDDAAHVSLTNATFQIRLEKHIADYTSGRGYRSEDVGAELRGKDYENNGSLLGSRALRYYQAMMSSMPYDKRARMIASVYDCARAMGKIKG